MINITTKQEDEKIIVILEGRLDTNASNEIEKDFKALNEQADKEIIFDCEKLEYISSSGLRLFISIRKTTAAKGGHVIIQHMNDSILSVFTMTGFIRLFEIRD